MRLTRKQLTSRPRYQVECTDRTVQYKLNAQSLRLFGLHRDVNDAHRAGANRLQNKKQTELWEKMGKNAKLKKRQKWSYEKLHLDNARKLRGIYFINPEDKEFKEIIKNARKKLETPVASAMRCKISKNNQNGGNGCKSNKIKSKLACTLEASESTRLSMGESLPNHHEDHIAGKGDNSLQHYNLFTNLLLCPKP